ncbi:MAG: hypothetical protein AAF597_07450 [Bacteroidota bacterium]
MSKLLYLVCLTFLCTSVRASPEPVERAQIPNARVGDDTACSIALIKAAHPFPADSFTLRTSLDTVPYGFAFDQDTILLDVTIFPPVDELSVELFRAGKSFGSYGFWVDAPSANVHLSVRDGQTRVDSVTLSGVDTWYWEQMKELSGEKRLTVLADRLAELADLTGDNLMSLTFADGLISLPNVTSGHIYGLREGLLPNVPFLLKRHPRYTRLKERIALNGRRVGNFDRLGFISPAGKPLRLKLPEKPNFYVLNLYTSDNARAVKDHQAIRDTPFLDSLFTQVAPMISISNDPSPALWRLYVRDNNFKWPHYVEASQEVTTLSGNIPFQERPVYLLMNHRHRVVGVYFKLTSVVNTVRWKERGN